MKYNKHFIDFTAMYHLIYLALASVAICQEVKVIELTPTVDYKYAVVERFDKGGTIESNTYAALQTEIKKKYICDFQSSFHPISQLGWGYVPAVCEEPSMCSGTYLVSEYLNKTCGHPTRIETICCPINSTTRFINTFGKLDTPQNSKHYEFQEVPTDFKLSSSNFFTPAVTGRNFEYVKAHEILETVSLPRYAEQFANELVCGFKKGRQIVFIFDTTSNLRNISFRMPFFCVPPNKCKPLEENGALRIPLPEWTDLCQNTINPKPEHNGKTACCHVEDIVSGYFSQPYEPLPELPIYLKYAPGFRSSYKCEQYSKEVCENGGRDNKCVRPREPFESIPQKYENFHFASLGFVVPKFMKFHCGGSLISIRYVISTITCKSYFGFTTNMVFFGDYDTRETADPTVDLNHIDEFYVISEILPYQTSGFRLKAGEKPPNRYTQVDLALYKTAKEVKLSPFVRPACIFYSNKQWPMTLDFIGFGVNDTIDAPREYIKHQFMKTLRLPKLPRSRCVQSTEFDIEANPYYSVFGVKQDYMVCYGSPLNPENGPCKHDRGGPLQIRMDRPDCSIQLLGVLSSDRFNCSRFEPSVFINVTKFIAEIEDEVWGDYTFLDIFDLDLETPACVNSRNLMFFTKCYGGVDCVSYGG